MNNKILVFSLFILSVFLVGCASSPESTNQDVTNTDEVVNTNTNQETPLVENSEVPVTEEEPILTEEFLSEEDLSLGELI